MKYNQSNKAWVLTSIYWFTIAAFLGAFLRFLFFSPVGGVNYKYLLHGHSHVIFLGWIFNIVFFFCVTVFTSNNNSQHKKYNTLFWLLQISIIGMLFSFPIQGYALYSITFSTIHVFLTYYFAYIFFNDSRENIKNLFPYSGILVKTGLIFYLISSLGPFALGIIMAKGLGASDLYYLSIYFYLHFQYNGLFTFAVFGMLFYLLENYKLSIIKKDFNIFIVTITLATLLSYSLSTLWTKPPIYIYIMGYISVILQLIGVGYLIKIIKGLMPILIGKFNKITTYLLIISFSSFLLKVILQTISSIPTVAVLAFTVKNFIIGYIHLIFIGFVSFFFLGWLYHFKLVKLKLGSLILIILGFLFSEVLIVSQPTMFLLDINFIIPYYYQSLFVFSFLIPIGLGIILLNNHNNELFNRNIA